MLMSKANDIYDELKRFEIKANDEYRLNKAHTENEWKYLCKMIDCCQELEDLNRAYPDDRDKWRRKKELYNGRAQEVRDILDALKNRSVPEQKNISGYETKPSIKPESVPKTEEHKRKSKFSFYAAKYGSPVPDESYVSVYSSKEVPPEMIRGWYQDFPDHDLSDIVGMDELKEKVKKELLNKIGWESLEEEYDMPTIKSYMFYGPYGTGKTFFVEALAMELMKKGFKFLRLGGADLHGKYVGSGEKAAKAAFNEAKDHAPCILFFDEFDNVCAERDGISSEGHEKRLSNELIQEYDNLKKSKVPVVFLTATNYPDKIDDAMLSRILTYLLIPLPEEKLRNSYFKNVFKKFKLADNLDYEYMADMTDNFSMRDLDKVKTYIKNDILENAKEKFGIKDENGDISPELSENIVSEAISSGKIVMTKELFDEALEKNPPEKKDDILASLKAFEKKS